MRAVDNIVLIGMPSAGKSSLGVVLAKILGYSFLDGDLLIQERYGARLPRIIEAEGAAGFIRIENEVLQTIDCEQTVIATGGSAIYGEEAMAHLSDIGTVVYIEVSEDDMRKRLGNLDERGVILRSGNTASPEALIAERAPLYERWADITVNTSGQDMTASLRALEQALADHAAE